MANISLGNPSGTISGPSIRILSLDGGGTRGLSSLIVLRDLMERVSSQKRIAQHDLRPSEYFDLIVGTGTGGISALFLGRLGMTVNEAISAYQQVAKAAFQRPTIVSCVLPWPRRSKSRLERLLGDIVKRCLDDRDAPFSDPSGDASVCRTAVLAGTSANVHAPPYIFRSYATSLQPSLFKIHEVARAAIALAGSSSVVSLGDPPVGFVCASLVGYNNPAEIAYLEAGKIWPRCRIACLISLGTGLQPIVQIGRWSKLIHACEQILQDCEQVHHAMYQSRLQRKLDYSRLNVTRGLHPVDIREWTRSGSHSCITGITSGYLRDPEVIDDLDSCAQSLLAATNTKMPVEIGIGKFLPLQNPAPENFHGRQEYVDRAVGMVVNRPGSRLAILGPGGIGKTAIALTILHDSGVRATFKDHSRFVSCEGLTCASLVDTLCFAFGLHNRSEGDRFHYLLAYLEHSYATRPLLLILDNFETVWDAEHSESEVLLTALAQVPLLSLMITMRGVDRPAGLQWTKPFLPVVEKLVPAAAHKVYLDICEKGDDKLDELLQALDCVPLAVTLMAHLGLILTPAQLLVKWHKEKTSLLSYSHNQGHLKNVDASILLSIESSQMKANSEALELLSIMALLPGGVCIEDLALIAPNIKECDLATITLLQVGLAYIDTSNIIHVLSPVRAYITKYHKPCSSHLKDMQKYYFKLAELGKKLPGDREYTGAVATLQKVEINMEFVLTKALETKDELRCCLKAALNWTSYLCYQKPRLNIIQLAVKLAESKGEEVEDLLSQCLQSLGNIQAMLSCFDAAQETISAAQTKFEAIGNPLGVAQCLQRLGNIQRMLNNYDVAQKILTAAQNKFEAIGSQYGAAQCLWSIGNIQSILNNYETAQEKLSAAQTKFEAIGDKMGAAECLQSLGDIQRTLHHYDTAQDILSAAKTKFEAIGSQLRVAQCLRSLGDIQRILNHFDTAQKMLSAAQDKFEAVGSQLGVAHCLRRLGDIQYSLYHYDTAQEMLSAAKTKFEHIGSKLGVAQCLYSLGNIQYMLTHYDFAQQMLSEAKGQFEAIGHQVGAVRCLKSLGDIHHMLNHNDIALKMLSTAQTQFEAIGSQLGAAQCLLSLGDIHCRLNHYDTAQEMLYTAQIKFQTIQDQIGAAKCLLSLGNIQCLLKKYDIAQEMLSSAHSMFIVLEDHLGVAQCLRSLGYLSQAQLKFLDAFAYMTKAKDMFASTGSFTLSQQEECSKVLEQLSEHVEEQRCKN